MNKNEQVSHSKHQETTVKPVLSGHPWGMMQCPLNTGCPPNTGFNR